MDNEYRRAANITITVAGIAVVVWLFFKYALTVTLPFIFAAVIASIVAPAADKLSSIAKIPKKVSSALLVFLFFSSVVSIIAFVFARLIGEISNIIAYFTENPEIIGNSLEQITDKFSGLFSNSSFLGKFFELESIKQLGLDLNALLLDALGSLLSSLTSAIPSAAMGILSKIPSIIFFLAVFLISAFYFCIDRDAISLALSSVIPVRLKARLPSIRKKISQAVAGYVKAYLCIMAITFAEMLLGLSILGVKYSLLLAIIISIVDILPVLGTGTVLIPWAIFCLFSSNLKLGIGLLVLYAICLIIRQISEPKIIGSNLGVHPVLTLASIYLGIKFFGLFGIFLGPISALIIKELFAKDIQAKT